MGVITFFRLEDLSVEDAGTITVHSETIPTGDANYLHLVVEVLKLGMTGGAPQFNFDVDVSNDTQNWVELSSFHHQIVTESTAQAEGAMRGAYFRVRVRFDLTSSSPGDMAFTTFTIVGNLLRSAD